LIVHITRTPGGRRIEQILAVRGFRDGRYLTADAELASAEVSSLIPMSKE
jgi:hypothetical protein